MDEEMGIYRGEVTAMMGALGDILVRTQQIIDLLEDEDDEEEDDA